MSDLALSFSYNGTHHKSDRSINPIEHLKMLIAAIDCANPKGEHDVIVSAICFDIWSMDQKERNIALEVYKRSRIVLSNSVQKNHQDGAATSIRMATEFAAATGKKYLIHLRLTKKIVSAANNTTTVDSSHGNSSTTPAVTTTTTTDPITAYNNAKDTKSSSSAAGVVSTPV